MLVQPAPKVGPPQSPPQAKRRRVTTLPAWHERGTDCASRLFLFRRIVRVVHFVAADQDGANLMNMVDHFIDLDRVSGLQR
jgi:hypothetical protein